MTELQKTIKQELDDLSKIEDSFIEEFTTDCMDLFQISFSDTNLYYKYVVSSGQILGDFISLEKYYEWKESLKG